MYNVYFIGCFKCDFQDVLSGYKFKEKNALIKEPFLKISYRFQAHLSILQNSWIKFRIKEPFIQLC